MNIVMAISSLGCGGAERALSILSEQFQRQGHRITVVTLASSRKDFFALAPGISRIELDMQRPSSGAFNAVSNNVARCAALRRVYRQEKPDVVVAFMSKPGILGTLASIGTGIPVIIAEHNDPRQQKLGFFWRSIQKIAYRYADELVFLTEELASYAKERYGREEVVVIPNPVVAPEFGEPEINLPGRFIAGMGRLVGLKGFDRLIKAYAKLDRQDVMLVILGDGPDRIALSKLADDLGVGSRVILPGNVRSPQSILRCAELYVLPSRTEAFPMALVEAMACSTAPVSFDCQSGPAEIISDGDNGVLVPEGDIDALAEAMAVLLCDQKLRQHIARNAGMVVSRFDVGAVTNRWMELICTLKTA